MIFLQYLINTGHYTDLFSNMKPTLHSWNEVHLVIVYYFVHIAELYLPIFCEEIFSSMLMKDIGLYSFLLLCLPGLGSKVNTSFIK